MIGKTKLAHNFIFSFEASAYVKYDCHFIVQLMGSAS